MKSLLVNLCLTFCLSVYLNGGVKCGLGKIALVCPGGDPRKHKDRYNTKDGESYMGPCHLINSVLDLSPKNKIMSPNGDFYCFIESLKTLPYAELLKFKDRWYEDVAGVYKYTVNNDLRFRYLSNVKNYFRHYEREAKKAGVEIETAEWDRYTFSIYGHEDLPPFTRFGYANFFHEQMWERDKEIRKKFLKEAVPLIKSCMNGASNQEIEEQIKFGWNVYEPRNKNGSAWYAFLRYLRDNYKYRNHEG